MFQLFCLPGIVATIGDKIVHTFIFLTPYFATVNPFSHSLVLFNPSPSKQCYVAIAVILSYKQATLSEGAGSSPQFIAR